MRIIAQFFLFAAFLFPICWDQAGAATVRGVYGIPSIETLHPSNYMEHLKRAAINVVFVRPDEKTVRWFKEQGFTVYVSVNVFGGKGAWKEYPGSRPITADGTRLGAQQKHYGSGGVCPTHRAWRKERIAYIEKLVTQFGPEGGIDGIWLDFIRYPGRWERTEPNIPDTCYCKRCLKKFRRDTKIKLPRRLAAREAAAWIAKQCPYEWMVWKKEQIGSFVAEARAVMGDRTMGIFLVPWTKGEKGNAISYRLAQDPFQLAEGADVISPMVYHKMCGQPESWVGAMTAYYKETAPCKVWPIVQSIDCEAEELSSALESAGHGDADGALVFSFKGMNEKLWKSFDAFQPPPNLIRNAALTIGAGKKPRGWNTGEREGSGAFTSSFPITTSESLSERDREATNCIGISAGNDQSGYWYSPLKPGEAGTEYVFTGEFYRESWKNGMYPSVSVWGEERYLNTHLITQAFQPLRAYVTCPEKPGDTLFRFMNYNPGETLWLTNPRLRRNYTVLAHLQERETEPAFHNGLFPIGVYGAALEDLKEIKRLGLNTVLISGTTEKQRRAIRRCRNLGLRYVLSVPRDPDKLPVYLDIISRYVKPQSLAFYVNDEPGIRSFPLNKAADIQRLIKDRFPQAATCMAVVRPQVCRDYLNGADFFMLDQYPVPHMPMTWLSDAMDEAAEAAGRNRLASVIQAFGGKRSAKHGWPRMPTWQEMDCLAFLSLVHGSRGIFFFTFREIGKTKKGREQLEHVVRRLKILYPWLIKKNLEDRVTVRMVSTNRFDPRGNPAIHCALKERGNQFLLLAVNAIGMHTEALLHLPESGDGAALPTEWREIFSQTGYPVVDGSIRARFKPYETKAFVSRAGSYRLP